MFNKNYTKVMKKLNKKRGSIRIQLQIDFLLHYELTPTKDDLDYELKEFGTLNIPCTIFYE